MDGKPQSERLQNLKSFQVYLLRYALLNFPKAKRIIYSTCSLHPEENEEVIDEVLADIGNAYRLVPGKQLLKKNWTSFSSERYNCGDRCLYSKPDVDFCNGFFVAVFERNFDVALPTCKRKGGNISANEANFDIERDGTTKRAEYKQKRRGKRKKKGTSREEVLTTDEQMKISKETIEFVTPKVENKVENEIETKRSDEKIEHVHTCPLSSLDYKEVALHDSQDIRKKMSENEKAKQSGKKRKSKHRNVVQVEGDEEKEIEAESPKRKKKRKKNHKELVKFNEIYDQEEKQDEETANEENAEKKEGTK